MGEHLKYLVWAQALQRPVACFALSSAPRYLGPRDRYIGWSAEARKRNIRFVVYNSRQVELRELKDILSRARAAPLSEGDFEKLDHAVDTLAYITLELERKGVSIKRLRKLLFGASTEKTSQVVAGGGGGRPSAARGEGHREKPQPRGHGRNGSTAYQGAGKVKVVHERLKPGDPCPECPNGKLYLLSEPAVLVRVTGISSFFLGILPCDCPPASRPVYLS